MSDCPEIMRTNGHGKPIVALDIDGTLGDYHGHFLEFAEGWLGQGVPPASMVNPGVPLWKHMGIDQTTYRECKLAYRQGGLKRTMPAFPGVSRLTKYLRADGLSEVWICTTRPYLRLDNIDPDTREWLRRNDIEYDGVLFDTLEGKGTKYAELHRQAGNRVAVIVEDLPEMILAARTVFPDVPVALRNQVYNSHINAGSDPYRALRVYRCGEDMLEYCKQAVMAWRIANGFE